jgi:hypothetical protein
MDECDIKVYEWKHTSQQTGSITQALIIGTFKKPITMKG